MLRRSFDKSGAPQTEYIPVDAGATQPTTEQAETVHVGSIITFRIAGHPYTQWQVIGKRLNYNAAGITTFLEVVPVVNGTPVAGQDRQWITQQSVEQQHREDRVAAELAQRRGSVIEDAGVERL